MERNLHSKRLLIFCRNLVLTTFLTTAFYLNLSAQITLNVSTNPGGINNITYTSLTRNGGAFAALNGQNLAGLTVTITITGNVTNENGANALYGDTWATFTIQPLGLRTISGNPNLDMINFYDHVSGVVVNGLNDGTNSLTISNRNAGINASAIAFYEGSSNNTITNCTITGSSVNETNGVIYFNANYTAPLSGNNNNTISNCNIQAASGGTPTNAIYSAGRTNNGIGNYNSGNTITNCLISDFFSPGLNSSGIFIHVGNHNWTITNNRIFQSASRSFTTNNRTYTGIKIEPHNNAFPIPGNYGYDFNISGNIIGFANSSGTGSTIIGGGFPGINNKVRGIEIVGVGTTSPTSIQNNTIAGFTQSTNRSSTNTLESCFIGIMLGSYGTGRFDVGTITGNTIGSLTSSSITINQASTTNNTARVYGIFDYSNSSNFINNNNIGGITIQGSGTRSGFTAISATTQTGLLETISGNTIGGPTAAGAININQTGNYTSYLIQTDLANTTITNNTIQNVNSNSYYTGFVVLSAINVDGSTGVNTITGNNIHSLSNNPGANNASIYAMDLSLPNTNNIVEKNKIHSIENTVNPAAQVVGMFVRTGRATYQNNAIRLGIDKLGNSISLGSVIFGIWNASTTADNRFYHNSVYIGGSGVNANAASFTSCLYGSATTVNRYYQNNNLVNVRQYSTSGIGLNTAVYYAGTATTGITSNYNNLYATGPDNFAGAYNGTGYYTLPAWTSGTTFDPISVSGNPLFVNATGTAAGFDLNIQTGSVCNNEALRTTPVTADDFNGVPRDNSLPAATPDIGAYELPRGTSPGTWIGVIDNDWNKPGNWDNGVVPTNSIDAYILRGHKVVGGNTDLPIIPSGSIAHSRNISLLHHNTTVNVTGTGLIRVAGSIFNRGIFDIKDGTLELNGISGTQLIAGFIFDEHSIKNLIINNNVNLLSVITNDTLDITGGLSFLGNNRTFNTVSTSNPTFGQLALKSTAAGTAWVADLTNNGANSNNRVTGNVSVERYIEYTGNWNLLAAPVSGSQSVFQSWQENGSPLISNGFGTQVTGPPPSTGFDNSSIGYSLKWWNSGTNAFEPVVNTQTGNNVNRTSGYFIFARGDRSYGPNTTGLNTTLRSNGPIYMGYTGSGVEPAIVDAGPIAANNFVSVANPFASTIDFAKVLLNTSVVNRVKPAYYLWDPELIGNYGVGQYRVMSSSNGWVPTPTIPTSGNVIYPGGTFTEIQSGQAFMIESDAGAGNVTIGFDENDKLTGSRLVTRGVEDLVMMSTMLHGTNQYIADGNRVVYDAAYSNSIGSEDASKMMNSAENLGILSNGRQLIVEGRKPIIETDTIFYNLSGLRTQAYTLSFEPRNLNATGLIAELVDKFLNTRTPISLSDSTYYNFEATANSASKAADRFMLVFRAPGGPLPVNFVSISAQRQADRSIKVNWQVTNEINIASYQVQRSADGINFTGILSQDASNSRLYTKTDLSPLAADNFYRIKAIGLAGEITYSAIVKVAPEKQGSFIAVQPNPVKDKQMNVRFANQPVGEYRLQLSNTLGQVMYRSSVAVSAAAMVKTIDLPATIAAGNYQLMVFNKVGEQVTSESIIIE